MAASTHYLCVQFLSLITICVTSNQNAALNFNTASKEYEMKMSQGKNTFLELISKGIFVDKTLLIDAFICYPYQSLVLLRPSGWGKTINLDMLRMFFKMPLYPNGTRILPISSTPNYRLFKEGKYHTNGYNITLKSPLLISQPEYFHLIEEHLGQYPVIHWSFDDIPFTNDSNEKAIIAEINKKACNQHRYLPTSPTMYDSLCEGNFRIPYLIKRLNDYFKKKAIVLVDCYERYPNAGTQMFSEIDYLLEWCSRSFYFNKEHKTLFIGTERRVKNLLSDPNIFNEISAFQNLYGFTSIEMSLIYNHYFISKQEQNLIQYWCGGYKLDKMKQEIFHPSATCSYLNTRQFESFSLHTKYNSYMTKLIKWRTSLYIFTRFINGGEAFGCLCLRQSPFSCDTPRELKYLLHIGYFIGHEFEWYRIPNFLTANHLRNTLVSYCTALFGHSWTIHLNETGLAWDWFLLSDEATSHKLQTNMQKCYKLMSKYYKNIIYTNFGNPISNSVKAQLSAVTSIMPSKKLHLVGWHYKFFPNNESDNLPETNILLSSGARGILISVPEDENEINSVVNQSSRYMRILQQYAGFHGWKDIKFVDCILLPYDKWKIKAVVRPVVGK